MGRPLRWHVLYAFTTGGLSLAWRLARASPFGAGLLTVGSLACVGFMLLLGAGVDEVMSRLEKMPRPRPDSPCQASAMECARQLFLTGADTQLAPPLDREARSEPDELPTLALNEPEAASRTLGVGTRSEPESSRDRQFRECLESRYKDQEMIKKAWRVAVSRVNSADAWDLVHATLLSVCLRAGCGSRKKSRHK